MFWTFPKNKLKRVIISESADIVTKNWKLKNSLVSLENNNDKYDQLEFFSNFDEERILSIFENFSSLDLIKLETLKRDYEMLGYNTDVINGH